jgi:hypothetical protein
VPSEIPELPEKTTEVRTAGKLPKG